MIRKLLIILIVALGTNLSKAQNYPSDCITAVTVCGNDVLNFQSNTGSGNVIDFSSSNHNVSNPLSNPASTNAGCLYAGEINSYWVLIHIATYGTLEFNIAAGLQAAAFDWIMWKYDTATCSGIFNNTIAILADNSFLPISMCNFNNVDKGVYLTTTSGNYASQYWVYGNQFNQNATAISAIGIAKLDIRQNTINNGVWPFFSLLGTSLGVYMNDVAFYSCNANNINNVEHAITALNSNGVQFQKNYIALNFNEALNNLAPHLEN
jgi:hypothetical protein